MTSQNIPGNSRVSLQKKLIAQLIEIQSLSNMFSKFQNLKVNLKDFLGIKGDTHPEDPPLDRPQKLGNIL
jgi:hypothetical protein